MSMVTADLSMSLDGFIAGPDGETEWVLHKWFFEPSEGNQRIVEELQDSIGAVVMGRRTYDAGSENDGFVDNPFPVGHVVLTHDVPDEKAKGETPFTFVTDGIESSLVHAEDLARDDEICVMGGADTVRQFIQADLLDEIRIHLVPVLLGDGIRLFEQLGTGPVELEPTGVVESSDATHLEYRVVNESGA